MANLRIAAKARGFQITAMNLSTFFRVFVIAIGVFFILWIGKSLLIPLVVAVFLFFLIIILSEGIQRVGYKKFRVPAQLAIPASLLLILVTAGFLADLIRENITLVIAKGPEYQLTFSQRIDELSAWLTSLTPNKTPIELGKVLEDIDFNINSILTQVGNSMRGLLASTGLILIYIMFLMLERRTFTSKLDALFPDTKKKSKVSSAIDQLRKRVETYIGIKTFNSALTGILSYLVLSYAGLDFASFWGVIIFVLNFIPTVGSIIATALPALLAMLQFGFDPINRFLTVLIGVGIIQFSIGNVLEPKLMGNSLNLSPLVILFSLALWGSLWGIPGMLLCVPFTVIVAIIAKEIPEARPLAIVLSGSGDIGDEPEEEEAAKN